MNLQKKYINVLNDYIKLFCEKTETYPDWWVTTENVHYFNFVYISDLAFKIDDIIYDIDTNQHKDSLFNFESENMGRYFENKKIMDYKSWLSGLSYKEFDKILENENNNN